MAPLPKSVRDAGRRAVKPALAGGAATAAAAVALAAGKALRPKRGKTLRIPVGHAEVAVLSSKGGGLRMRSLSKKAAGATKLDLDAIAKGVTRTGRQLGGIGRQVNKLGGDVERAGRTAERIGRILAQ